MGDQNCVSEKRGRLPPGGKGQTPGLPDGCAPLCGYLTCLCSDLSVWRMSACGVLRCRLDELICAPHALRVLSVS